jgi:hypothetical protein
MKNKKCLRVCKKMNKGAALTAIGIVQLLPRLNNKL